jgi:hypothetical protein
MSDTSRGDDASDTAPMAQNDSDPMDDPDFLNPLRAPGSEGAVSQTSLDPDDERLDPDDVNP